MRWRLGTKPSSDLMLATASSPVRLWYSPSGNGVRSESAVAVAVEVAAGDDDDDDDE